MNISSNGINLIKRFEGCALKAYPDAVGIPTIGYGSIVGVHMGMEISQEQAEERLHKDLEPVIYGINKCVLVPINQNQFDALCSFSFNLGIGALKKSTLLKLLLSKEYDLAANEFLKWNKAGGKTLPGLTKRREAEKELFLS